MGRTANGFADVNGTRLYYEVAGDGDPIALVHGFSLDSRMWDAQVDALAERYRVIRYDVRGFGRSDVPTGVPFQPADDLRALLKYLDEPSAHVVGLSMGGRIALSFALLHPTATRSLVLVDSALDGFEWSDAWNASMDAIAAEVRRSGIDAAKQMWLDHELFAPALERAACAAVLSRIVDDWSGWHWLNESPATSLDPPAAARLAEIGVPTLVVVGERDLPDFHRIADKLVRGIPSATKVVMRGVGHMANMENPAEFNALLLKFLQAQSVKA